MESNIQSYSYDKSKITSGILHIGVGNFHRAHQAFYLNQLLQWEDQQSWGIIGVCLLPSDEKTVHLLRAQQLEYTLTVCGRDGKDEVYTIGAHQELLWGVEESESVISKMADKSVKIISLTITEGGYNINKESGEFMLDTAPVVEDLQNPSSPKTVFGYVAEGLRKRMRQHGSGLTILCCDNLQHNGDTAQKAFLSFMRAQDPGLASWVEKHVTFPNSMVDRITPATTIEDVVRLNERNGTADKVPVFCEDFIQWVIEDRFATGRPALERVGVTFTEDVTAYENMKLSLLNASHTLLSYPSFLKGYRKVDEAMQDPSVVKLVKDFMDQDMTPYVPAPGQTDLDQYKLTLIERFANHSVSDQISRLCFDGISKFPVYVMPNLAKMLADHKDLSRVAFLIAAYRHYLKYQQDDDGHDYEIAEPWLSLEDELLIQSNAPEDFLGLSAFQGVILSSHQDFLSIYNQFVSQIQQEGAGVALETVMQ